MAGIAAFGRAAERAAEVLFSLAGVRALRDRIEAHVRAEAGAEIFSDGADRLANTLAFALPGLPAETALIAFDLAGVAISSGSACSSGQVTTSAVLSAMGYGPEVGRGGLRVSLGAATTAAEVDRFIDVETARDMCRLSPYITTGSHGP